MIVCGIEMAASEARIVVLNGSKASYTHVQPIPAKLKLADDENAAEVRAFQDAINAFLRENHVELVAIKKRGKRGDYAGGPIGFKIEGIVQLYPDCEVSLVSPPSIAAAKRHYNPILPETCRKYQQAAFETAFTALE